MPMTPLKMQASDRYAPWARGRATLEMAAVVLGAWGHRR